MKNLILKFIIFIFPISTLLIVINYIGDSAHIFNEGYESKMVQIIRDGNYVTNIDNYNERIFQEEIIKNMNSVPETIVLGASRSVMINGLLLENTYFFNNSVSGASIEDYIAIYQIYKEYNKISKTVIIDIEPYLFNKHNNQNRWVSLQKYYNDFYKITNSKSANNSKLNKYKELISFSYFQSSLSKIPKVISGNNMPKETNIKFNNTNTKLTDGTIVYGKSYRNASQNNIEIKVNSFLAKNLYSIERFKKIDKDIWTKFEKLILDMKKNNIKINFFLCPYHPKVYNRIKTNYPMVLETEDLIIKFAKRNGIRIYGTFNPVQIGFDKTYFYDAMHCKPKGIKKILQCNE